MTFLPEVVIFDIARFTRDDHTLSYVKNKTPLKFTDEIVVANQPYHAFAVIVHEGDSIDIGHYVAYVKKGTTWFKFSDKSFAAQTAPFELPQQATVVFARKVNKN